MTPEQSGDLAEFVVFLVFGGVAILIALGKINLSKPSHDPNKQKRGREWKILMAICGLGLIVLAFIRYLPTIL